MAELFDSCGEGRGVEVKAAVLFGYAGSFSGTVEVCVNYSVNSVFHDEIIIITLERESQENMADLKRKRDRPPPAQSRFLQNIYKQQNNK